MLHRKKRRVVWILYVKSAQNMLISQNDTANVLDLHDYVLLINFGTLQQHIKFSTLVCVIKVKHICSVQCEHALC